MALSGHGVLLPIPDDPRFQAMVENFDTYAARFYPRSSWLHDFERLLREHYPQSSSRDRSLTARHAAPFYLADGPNVP